MQMVRKINKEEKKKSKCKCCHRVFEAETKLDFCPKCEKAINSIICNKKKVKAWVNGLLLLYICIIYLN